MARRAAAAAAIAILAVATTSALLVAVREKVNPPAPSLEDAGGPTSIEELPAIEASPGASSRELVTAPDRNDVAASPAEPEVGTPGVPDAEPEGLIQTTIDTAEQRSAFVHYFLKPRLETIHEVFKGQTRQRLMEGAEALPASRRAQLDVLAQSIDELWIAYEFECAAAAIDYAEKGGKLERSTGRVDHRKGRSMTVTWLPPEGTGFGATKAIEVSYMLRFETYPRMQELLAEYWRQQRQFDELARM